MKGGFSQTFIFYRRPAKQELMDVNQAQDECRAAHFFYDWVQHEWTNQSDVIYAHWKINYQQV